MPTVLLHGSPDSRGLLRYVVAVLLLASSASAAAQTTWRAGWGNDLLVGSDNQFTNGVFLQKISGLEDSLAATSDTPAFGKSMARFVLPARGDLHYREIWTLGHNMQTPGDIDRADLIPTDVPYVSMLAWANSFIAFNDRELTGFQLLLGWAGDLTLGEQAQTIVHEIVDASEPEGWDHQLENEPLLNLYLMRKRKFHDNDWMDAAWNLDAALGNFFSYGQAAVEVRLGDRPGGFAPAFTPIGRNLDHDARIQAPGESYLYASMIFRATGLLFALPRHGNLLRTDNEWTDNERIDPENLIGQLLLGLHYERPNWGLHFTYNLATDSVDRESGPEIEDKSNSFGILVGEWKF